jgi:hypothetical protein
MSMEHEPGSDDVDRLLADEPAAGERLAQARVRVYLEIPMDGITLALLQQRADRERRPRRSGERRRPRERVGRMRSIDDPSVEGAR